MVCFSYDFKAASKMTLKREEAVDEEAVWDIGEVGTVEESKIILRVRVGTRKVNPAQMVYGLRPHD